MRKLAILMTCYNRVRTTLDCLRKLSEQELPADVGYDVWLVDDGSPDKTGERVKQEFPSTHVIYSDGSLFWCKGMRLAWETATAHGDYDFYLWLNDDVVLGKGSLLSLLEDSRSLHDKSIIVGTTTQDGTLNSRITYGLCNENKKFIVPCGRPQAGKGRMNGNVVLIPTFVFKSIGYICGLYQHGYGDHDYGFLAMRKHIAIYVGSIVAGACQNIASEHYVLSGQTFFQRIASLWSIKGLNLHDALIYKYRRTNLVGAILSFFHIVWIAIRGDGVKD